jgi:AraC-like DNA-binding protein
MLRNHQKLELEHKCLIEKVVLEAPFRFSVHFRDEACFIYFSKGAAKINSPAGQTDIGSKEAVLLKCGSYFADLLKYGTSGEYEVLVVHLYPDMLRKIYKQEIPSFVKDAENRSFIHKTGAQNFIQKFVEGIYYYLDNPDLVNNELLELKVKELLLLLVQTNNGASITSLFSDLFTPREVSIKEVIDNHVFSGISIEDLASLSNLSVSTFNRSFQSLFNDTPASYIKTKRLQRARDLLSMSTLTVSEIAFQTCFKDVGHFSRSFKAAYHCSPSAYRLAMKKC